MLYSKLRSYLFGKTKTLSILIKSAKSDACLNSSSLLWRFIPYCCRYRKSMSIRARRFKSRLNLNSFSKRNLWCHCLEAFVNNFLTLNCMRRDFNIENWIVDKINLWYNSHRLKCSQSSWQISLGKWLNFKAWNKISYFWAIEICKSAPRALLTVILNCCSWT